MRLAGDPAGAPRTRTRRHIATASWATSAGASHLATDFGNALLATLCFGALGFGLGVLLRSTVLALGAGLAWLGPQVGCPQLIHGPGPDGVILRELAERARVFPPGATASPRPTWR